MVGTVEGRGPLSALSTWTCRCHRSAVHRPCALQEEARKTWSMSYMRDPYNTLAEAKLSCRSSSSSPILSMNEHHLSPFLTPTFPCVASMLIFTFSEPFLAPFLVLSPFSFFWSFLKFCCLSLPFVLSLSQLPCFLLLLSPSFPIYPAATAHTLNT